MRARRDPECPPSPCSNKPPQTPHLPRDARVDIMQLAPVKPPAPRRRRRGQPKLEEAADQRRQLGGGDAAAEEGALGGVALGDGVGWQCVGC